MKKYSNETIDQLVAELRAIDPKLTARVLRPIVIELLADRPAAVVDEEFRLALKTRLMRVIQANQTNNTLNQFHPLNFMNKFKLILATAGAVGVAVLIFLALPKDQNLLPTQGAQISKISDNAFGNLGDLSSVGKGGGAGGAGATAPVGLGGGGGPAGFAPMNYKFVYKGAAFSIDAPKMDVFRRQKGLGFNSSFSQLTNKFNLGMLNLTKFADSKLVLLQTSEDKDFGYTLSLNLQEGTVAISEAWDRWLTPDRLCRDQACYDQHRIRLDQVPTDSALIQTTNQFMDDYGINRSNYGEPYVQNSWRTEYDRSPEKQNFYIPDVLTVVYPQRIAGQDIYDEQGNKTGLFVTVNLRVNKVSNLGDLTAEQYQSSAYATEQDPQALTKLAEAGGLSGVYPTMDASGKPTVVDLGTPKLAYVKMWQMQNGQGAEVLVPSLIFPLLTPQSYYPQSIVIPVIKDILASRQPNPTINIQK